MKSILYLQQRPKNRERTCRKNFCSSCRCSRVFLVQAQCIKLACKASWNTLRDLRKRRYLTSSAALPCSTPPPGPSHRWAVQSRENVVEQENTKEKSNRFFTLKLLKVTRIGRQPRISGPVVNRANCSKWRRVTSKLELVYWANHLLYRKLASDTKAVSEKVLDLQNLNMFEWHLHWHLEW